MADDIVLSNDSVPWARVREGPCCDGECLTFNYINPDGSEQEVQTMYKTYAVELALAILEVAGAEPYGVSTDTFERFRLDLKDEIKRSQEVPRGTV